MWILNILLYLFFLFNPKLYEEFKAAGAPCYIYIGDQPDAPPPPCLYSGEAQ